MHFCNVQCNIMICTIIVLSSWHSAVVVDIYNYVHTFKLLFRVNFYNYCVLEMQPIIYVLEVLVQ